jgi:hypothetical protein
MPVMISLTWDGVTASQYDELRKVVNWEGNKAPGGMFHVAGFSEQGAKVSDVWETAEDFNRFVEQRLMPGVAKVGIKGEPKVEVLAAHAIFAPAYQKL